MKPADRYSESHWRNVAAPIIRKVIEEHAGAEESVIRAALRDAYPFGDYEYQQMRIWMEECCRQMAIGPQVHPEPDPRQENLFD